LIGLRIERLMQEGQDDRMRRMSTIIATWLPTNERTEDGILR
jgi:hypothetical protein